MNIIYLLPSEKKPTGGIKVILDHSQIINNTKNEFNSSIIFIKKKKMVQTKLIKTMKEDKNLPFGNIPSRKSPKVTKTTLYKHQRPRLGNGRSLPQRTL